MNRKLFCEMCQFTNLIHRMVLHSPFDITEHHHHDGFDFFPTAADMYDTTGLEIKKIL